MRLLFMLCVCLLLGACGGAPEEAQLRRDVETRVTEALPADVLALESVAYRGSQKDIDAPSGENRRIVYFDAELRLRKAYDFGAWDSPGVAGLISALGTGPKGLTGVVSGGNRAGDVIRAHGTAIYKRGEEGEWIAVAPQGYANPVAPSFATGAPRPAPEIMLEAMREVIDNAPPETAALTREVILQELQSAYTAIQARVARVSQGTVIAAGPNGGQYLRFAQALRGQRTRMVSLVTAGGEVNLGLVREGRASLGLVQGDSALLAYRGEGPFAVQPPYTQLRAIGSLYPEPVHVVVRADSGIERFEQLAGRRVVIGVPGAASRTTVVAVLEAHGITLEQLQPLELSLSAGLVALRERKADALIQVIGFPSDNIRDATTAVSLRLLPLSEQAVRKLVARNPALFQLTLPAGTYPNQRQPVYTVATAAVMITSGTMTDAEVEELTRSIYGQRDDLVARGSAQGAQLSPANARLGLAIPLHEAAAKVLEELQPSAAAVTAP